MIKNKKNKKASEAGKQTKCSRVRGEEQLSTSKQQQGRGEEAGPRRAQVTSPDGRYSCTSKKDCHDSAAAEIEQTSQAINDEFSKFKFFFSLYIYI